MQFFPASLENLVDKFASLPGIGKKSAQRLAFHLLSLPMRSESPLTIDA
jgi:recombination protein RecR